MNNIIYSKGGDYFLTITDFNNCILKDTIMITENSEIQFTVESEPSNKHFCDGEKITLFATGDAGFIWENGPSDKIFEVFETGTYRVTGTKMENGYPCSINKTISVVKDTLPIINFRSSKGIKDTIFYICKSDSLEITAIDNIGGYTFKWDNGNLDGFRTLIQNKSYSVTVSDKNTGCVANSKLDLKYYETIDIQIHLLNDDLSFPDSSILCFSDNPYLNLESNGTFSGSLFSYFNIDWSSNNPEVVVEKINSNKEARIKYGNSNFIIYLEARERTQSCFSKDSIQITIQSPQTNIVEENYCGVILLKDDYVLNEPLPPNITNLNNGFYYVQGIAKLSYTFKKDCSDTMAMPIINDLSGDKFINDDLIYDECGPFLLAKEKEGVCYTWYEINKQSKKPTLLTGKEDSWLKLNSSIDVENNTYIAIIHDCSDICDSTVIFTRSDESGKTIPCYNSGESAIKIYPNPNQGHMYLKLEGLPAGKQEVFIYDMMGRQVYKKTIDHTGNNDITELSLTHLPDGIYFAKTYYNGTGISTKFIITH